MTFYNYLGLGRKENIMTESNAGHYSRGFVHILFNLHVSENVVSLVYMVFILYICTIFHFLLKSSSKF